MTIFVVRCGVKISKKQTNAQNAHLVDNVSVESKKPTKENNRMGKKLTGEQYRMIAELQGKDVADMMASTLGVAQARIGKLSFAPTEVQNSWNDFQSVVELYLEEWNNNLPEGVATIKKVDLNIKK